MQGWQFLWITMRLRMDSCNPLAKALCGSYIHVLPDLMYLTTLLTRCLCLLCPLAITTLPFHVICGLFSVSPFVTPLPLYSFLNMLNGSIVKLCFLWLPLDTSFPL